ncbi:trichohyalin-like isoform X2 [Adelges cooleyi]|uniref:trichohyalin-like isoform X2 n=1 Tax=Adelges cooleyi TaxID=133065 RepID=UPI00217FA940|nr:trichohyalin-like isoform X2 [Adelges cooleyi]
MSWCGLIAAPVAIFLAAMAASYFRKQTGRTADNSNAPSSQKPSQDDGDGFHQKKCHQQRDVAAVPEVRVEEQKTVIVELDSSHQSDQEDAVAPIVRLRSSSESSGSSTSSSNDSSTATKILSTPGNKSYSNPPDVVMHRTRDSVEIVVTLSESQMRSRAENDGSEQQDDNQSDNDSLEDSESDIEQLDKIQTIHLPRLAEEELRAKHAADTERLLDDFEWKLRQVERKWKSRLDETVKTKTEEMAGIEAEIRRVAEEEADKAVADARTRAEEAEARFLAKVAELDAAKSVMASATAQAAEETARVAQISSKLEAVQRRLQETEQALREQSENHDLALRTRMADAEVKLKQKTDEMKADLDSRVEQAERAVRRQWRADEKEWASQMESLKGELEKVKTNLATVQGIHVRELNEKERKFKQELQDQLFQTEARLTEKYQTQLETKEVQLNRKTQLLESAREQLEQAAVETEKKLKEARLEAARQLDNQRDQHKVFLDEVRTQCDIEALDTRRRFDKLDMWYQERLDSQQTEHDLALERLHQECDLRVAAVEKEAQAKVAEVESQLNEVQAELDGALRKDEEYQFQLTDITSKMYETSRRVEEVELRLLATERMAAEAELKVKKMQDQQSESAKVATDSERKLIEDYEQKLSQAETRVLEANRNTAELKAWIQAELDRRVTEPSLDETERAKQRTEAESRPLEKENDTTTGAGADDDNVVELLEGQFLRLEKHWRTQMKQREAQLIMEHGQRLTAERERHARQLVQWHALTEQLQDKLEERKREVVENPNQCVDQLFEKSPQENPDANVNVQISPTPDDKSSLVRPEDCSVHQPPARSNSTPQPQTSTQKPQPQHQQNQGKPNSKNRKNRARQRNVH